jgi:hypothetical protein
MDVLSYTSPAYDWSIRKIWKISSGDVKLFFLVCFLLGRSYVPIDTTRHSKLAGTFTRILDSSSQYGTEKVPFFI